MVTAAQPEENCNDDRQIDKNENKGIKQHGSGSAGYVKAVQQYGIIKRMHVLRNWPLAQPRLTEKNTGLQSYSPSWNSSHKMDARWKVTIKGLVCNVLTANNINANSSYTRSLHSIA